MKSKKISIIVPIYNAQKYLKKCINSLINQSYKNLEIILIDDESTDNSPKICDEYSKKDKRIKVIHKLNGGVSSSRNEGLKNTTGDYILFVDADDYIEPNCIEECLNIIEKYHPDIIKFGFTKELNLYKKKNTFTVKTNTLIEEKNYNNLIYKYILTTPDFCNIWNSIIKKEICIQNQFDTNLTLGEDYLYFIKCLTKSKRIYFLDKHLYHYVINNNSITHKFNIKQNIEKLKNGITANIKIQKLINDNGYTIKKDYRIQNANTITANIDHAVKHSNYKKFCYYIQEIKKDKFLNKYLIDTKDTLPKHIINLLNTKKIDFYITKIIFSIKKIIKSLIEKIS